MAVPGEYQLDPPLFSDQRQVVSTGQLPASESVRAAVVEAHERFGRVTGGASAAHYPALARADPNLFGIAVVSAAGEIVMIGDAEVFFTIMSIAKPFVMALVCEAIGPEQLQTRIGVNATGRPFDSGIPLEESAGHLTNPMVNSGALATTSLAPGGTTDERWEGIVAGLSGFAGRQLLLDEEVYISASESNHRNRALANLLASYDRLYGDASETVELYTRQSCLKVTAVDLAVMGSTLAGGGVNPLTGERVAGAATCRRVLAAMATAGLYETSGDWLYDVGLPGKSGVGGGIVTVSPGKGSLATFSPPLDSAGNSVRGQLVARFLARRLGLDLFSSTPNSAHNGANRKNQSKEESPDE